MGNMIGGGTTAAADDIDQSLLGEFAHQRRGVASLLVVLAEGVGQAGVWIGADRDVGYAREVLDIRPQLLRPERAIQPDYGGLGVADRVPERLDRLARERSAGSVGNR